MSASRDRRRTPPLRTPRLARAQGGGGAFRVCRALYACRRGDAVLELALVLPLVLLLFSGLVETGRLVSHAATIDKALRGAGLYAARMPQPLDAAGLEHTRNLVRTGSVDGSAAPLLPYLADEGATVAVETRGYTLDGLSLPVLRVTLRVPYRPLLGDLVRPFGLNEFVLEFSHEQPHLGG